MDIVQMAEEMALAMSEMEGRLVQQIDSVRQEIRNQPNYRKVRRVWMKLGDYVRSRFRPEDVEAKKQWIRRRLMPELTHGRGPFDNLYIRSRCSHGITQIHTGDADRLLGFEE